MSTITFWLLGALASWILIVYSDYKGGFDLTLFSAIGSLAGMLLVWPAILVIFIIINLGNSSLNITILKGKK